MTDPFTVAILTGSPSKVSRSSGVAEIVAHRLGREAFRVRTIHVRELPAQALLSADSRAPELAQALDAVVQADGLVVASPVYKAAYSGVLKAFLDLLPQRGLSGKVVLPLLTGGTLAHVLALDYGLRPVLQSLEPALVVAGLFLHDPWVSLDAAGSATLDGEAAGRLEAVTRTFIDGLRIIAQA